MTCACGLPPDYCDCPGACATFKPGNCQRCGCCSWDDVRNECLGLCEPTGEKYVFKHGRSWVDVFCDMRRNPAPDGRPWLRGLTEDDE